MRRIVFQNLDRKDFLLDSNSLIKREQGDTDTESFTAVQEKQHKEK